MNNYSKKLILKTLSMYDFLTDEQKRKIYCSIAKNQTLIYNTTTKTNDQMKSILEDLINEAVTHILADTEISLKTLFSIVSIYYYKTVQVVDKTNCDIVFAQNVQAPNNYQIAEFTENDLYMLQKAEKDLRQHHFSRSKQKYQSYFENWTCEEIKELYLAGGQNYEKNNK